MLMISIYQEAFHETFPRIVRWFGDLKFLSGQLRWRAFQISPSYNVLRVMATPLVS